MSHELVLAEALRRLPHGLRVARDNPNASDQERAIVEALLKKFRRDVEQELRSPFTVLVSTRIAGAWSTRGRFVNSQAAESFAVTVRRNDATRTVLVHDERQGAPRWPSRPQESAAVAGAAAD